MNKKQMELIRFLDSQSKPVSGNELANALQVSSRSVKNYVQEINNFYDKRIIASSRSGYELNTKTASSLLIAVENETIPQTVEERAYYIIKQLVLNHATELDLFELCDFLCVSYSTIKSVISKMNKTFSAYNVEFFCRNDCVLIKGAEKDKRKLISFIINEEANNSYINIDLLRETFTAINIDVLQEIIVSTFKAHNYYLNDFAAVNLLLHLLVIIDRGINGNELESGQADFEIASKTEANFLKDFESRLEKAFKIDFNRYERFELYMLFKTSANFSLDASNEDLKKVVGVDIIQLTNEYVQKINNLYMIDLSSPTFTGPFALHLKNLILRAKSGRFTNNPMAQAIKLNSPIVFDIAIYISLNLMDLYDITINEDEAAFLAIHIGAEIERQTRNTYKVPAVLVCPSYHNMSSTILNTLMTNFDSQLNILCSIANESRLAKIIEEKEPAIIFSTIPLSTHYSGIEIISLSPLNLASQFEAIQMAISRGMELFKDQKLRINFHHFFEEELFVANSRLKNKQEIITHLCDKLLEKKYVDLYFKENVYRRENAATTAFNHVAIPHSVEMDADKTSIAVAISKKGFQWDTNTVYVVLLLAINKADKRTFRYLYESLISLFGEDEVVQDLRNCTSFSDFEKLIYMRIDGKG